MRVLAILAVIVIHTTPFETSTEPVGTALDAATLINQASRFAVPFFFVIAGYFWSVKCARSGDVLAVTRAAAGRAGLLFVAWSAIYLLPWDLEAALGYGPWGPAKVVYWNLLDAARHPIAFAFQGTKPHLWYLPSLALSYWIAAALVLAGRRAWLLPVAGLLFAAGVSAKAYEASEVGIHLGLNARNGPFLGLVFVVLGDVLARATPRRWWLPLGCVLAASGLVAQWAEVFSQHARWGTVMAQDFVFGTLPFGFGVALVAFGVDVGGWKTPGVLRAALTRLAPLGRLVPGIYTSHFVFVDALKPLERRHVGGSAWEVLYPLLVFACATGASALLGGWRTTRRLVA